MSPSNTKSGGYSSAFFVYGSDTGHLGNPLVHTSTGGVRPEFLLGIGKFIGNYSRIN